MRLPALAVVDADSKGMQIIPRRAAHAMEAALYLAAHATALESLQLNLIHCEVGDSQLVYFRYNRAKWFPFWRDRKRSYEASMDSTNSRKAARATGDFSRNALRNCVI